MVSRLEENNDYEMIKVVNENNWRHLNDEEIKEQKFFFVENYFTVRKRPYNRHGKTFEMIPEANTEESKSVIRGLYSQYGYLFEGDYENFMGEVMAGVTTAVIQFNPNQNEFNWMKVNEKGTGENKSLHAYIVKPGKTKISVLESEIMRYTNFTNWKERSGDKINGLDMMSLDAIMTDENGEETSFHDVCGEESSVTYRHTNYFEPHLVVWFKEWMEEQKKLRSSNNRRIRSTAKLTSHQIIYYDTMKDIFLGQLVSDEKGYVETWAEQVRIMKKESHKGKKNPVINIYSQQNIYDYNRAIREAALSAYREEFPNGGKTFVQMRMEKEKAVLDEVIAIMESDKYRLSAQNGQISKWIINNFEEQVVQDIIYDKLSSADLGNIIAGKMSRKKLIESKTLYRFVAAVEEKLENQSKLDASIQKNKKLN